MSESLSTYNNRKIEAVGGSAEIIWRILWGMLGGYIILSALFRWQWLSSYVPIAPLVATVFTLAIIVLIYLLRHPIGISLQRARVFFTAIPIRYWIFGCLVIGIAFRLGASAIAPGIDDFVSDAAVYWDLAQRLAVGDPYEHPFGRSFWPPGLPLMLAPFIAVFGPERWVVLFVNLLLYIATSTVAFFLAKRLADDCLARTVIMILAIWPNLALLASFPNKELLVTLLLPTAMLFYLRGTEMASHGKWQWINFVGCGMCLGFAALTQPATMLFGFVFLGYEALVSTPWRHGIFRLAIAGIVTILTILPWTVRNYAIHGEFIPINTAGGVVLYSANNANASGGWIPDNLYIDSDFQQSDEIANNRIAFKKAFAWINENRLQFLKLIILKQTRFLCCDDTGAFALFDNPLTPHLSNPAKYRLIALISDTFWILLALLMLYVALNPNKFTEPRFPVVFLIPLSICYFLVIFSLFQSESKHNTMAAVFFALMASYAFQPEQNKQPQLDDNP